MEIPLLTFLCFELLRPNSMVSAQNLEMIEKNKPLTISVGVSFNHVFYGAHGIESRRDPYIHYFSGNVSFSLYGLNIPLSFNVSNQNTTFQQPFNHYSLHPTYKWITGHVGYISTSYSPYTVSGHIFLGGAVDLAPEGKWKLSAFFEHFVLKAELASIKTTESFQMILYCYFKMIYG